MTGGERRETGLATYDGRPEPARPDDGNPWTDGPCWLCWVAGDGAARRVLWTGTARGPGALAAPLFSCAPHLEAVDAFLWWYAGARARTPTDPEGRPLPVYPRPW